MNIKPPKPDHTKENPFKDSLNRENFGDSLFNLFKNINDNIVLCVDAPWGEGKTTFANMWIEKNRNRKEEGEGIESIFYNAYEHDFTEDPFISFSSEILSAVDIFINKYPEIKDEIKIKKKDFKKKALKVGAKLITTTGKIGIKAATLGVIKDSDIEALQDVGKDIATDTSNYLSKVIEEKINNYAKEKDSIESFKKSLSDLGKSIYEKQNFPLLVIIDELDRCRPDFALTLIERVKHLFNTENVSFLLLVNMQQLENYVSTIYGQKIDAHNYLHKFIDVRTSLPKSNDEIGQSVYFKYYEYLNKHYSSGSDSVLENDIVKGVLLAFFEHFKLSLREIERVIVIIRLYFSSLPRLENIILEIMSFLAIIKIKFPNVFKELIENKFSYESFVNKTGLLPMLINNDEYKYWFNEVISHLQFLLFTDEKYTALEENDGIRNYEGYYANLFGRRIVRRKILPKHCNSLSTFAVN